MNKAIFLDVDGVLNNAYRDMIKANPKWKHVGTYRNPTRRNETMKKFIPKEKLGKKARKQLDSEQRATWTFPR